ncbi:MAG: VCBS repeat-containing protein [Polyangiales bacterium]
MTAAFQRATRLCALLSLLAIFFVGTGCDRTTIATSDAASPRDAKDVPFDIASDVLDVSDAPVPSDESPPFDGPVPFDAAIDRVDASSEPRDPFADVRTMETGSDFFGDCGSRFDASDAAPSCMLDSSAPCACAAGPTGNRICLEDLTWSACQCPLWGPFDFDGGVIIDRVSPDVFEPIPTIPGPRLLAPQSGSRVTTQRPTLRWRLPDGVTRARVELYEDRACTRMLTQQEVTGASWRPSEPLAHGVVFWRVRALGEAGGVTWTSATWEFGVPRRDSPVDTSYGVLKDFNGDGYDDIVTQSSYTRPFGGIRIFPGGPDGVSGERVRVLNPPEPPSWETHRDGNGGFGPLFSVGDLNGDGLSDVIAGSASYRELPFDPAQPAGDGRVYLFLGSRTCTVTLAETSYRPSERGRPFSFGRDVSVGDFNGDGYADMLATARGDSGYAEEMKLYLGGPAGPSETPASAYSLGTQTAQFVGDLNGDGFADVIARTRNYQEAGLNDFAIVILSGNPEGRLDFHTQYFELPFRSPLFDWIMRWGDVNEDGYADAVISFNGRICVFPGSSEGVRGFWRLNTPPDTGGGTGGPSFGIGMSMPADLDGDGHAELLAGAEAARSDDGQVYLFPHHTSGLSLMWSQEIPGPTGSRQGFSVPAIVGDVDGDGFNDVAIGATLGLVPRLYLYSGGVGRWWERPRLMILGPISIEIQ